MNNNNGLTYLVYDIESVTNKKLLNRVLYPNENLTDEQAYTKHVKELMEKDGKTFVNPSFHKPVALAAIGVREDFSISKVGLLGGEKPTSATIVKNFWELLLQKRPILVDFNGKGYDLRLMELWAFQLGLSLDKRYFEKFGIRYRYADERQIDLQDFLCNNGSIRFQGGLNFFSKLLGKPGKMDTKGEMVQELYDSGDHFRIGDYCLSDAMDTYFVFLRTRVLRGELNLQREHILVEEAKALMEKKSSEEGYFKEYLAHFGYWIPDEHE